MDIDEIKTLTQLMVDNDLSEIILKDGERRILLRRRGAAVEPVYHAAPMHAMPMQVAPPVQQPAQAAAPAASPAPVNDPSQLKISSPMVGTFYSAANPESPPYIRVGDRVNPDTVVCIIEAMKVFNEIKAEVAGTVESIEVQNGAAVEFGQILMRVRAG